MDVEADFEILLKRIPGRGSPVFYVSYIASDGDAAPRSNRRDQASELVEGTSHTQRVYATRALREQ